MRKSDLSFLHVAERLKNILRHAHVSSGRKESDADHSWRAALMALVLCPKGLDRDKCVRLALVHDLCEAYAGDVYALSRHSKKEKADREKESLKKTLSVLEKSAARREIFSLWEEFENAKTPEARFVKAIDKLEVLIQHNESDLKTWAPEETKIHFGLASMHAKRFRFLRTLAREIDAETGRKLGKSRKRITKDEYLRYYPLR